MVDPVNPCLRFDDETAVLIDELSSVAIAIVAILLALLHWYSPVLAVATVQL